MLQVFAERNNIAVGLLDSAVAAEDFEGGAETGENRVGADDAFLGETRHPFVNSAGECGENISPITDLVITKRSIGSFSGAADEMNRRCNEAAPALRCNSASHLGIYWP